MYTVESENAVGHLVHTEHDLLFSAVTREIDPNNLETRRNLTVDGQIDTTTYPDGTSAKQSWSWVAGSNDPDAPALAVTRFTLTSRVGPPTIEYHDQLNRALRRVSFGSGGDAIYVDTQYDNLGRIVAVSQPYFGHSQSPLFTRTQYDILGRETAKTMPDGEQITSTYNGACVTKTNPKGHSLSVCTNAAELPVRIQDSMGLLTMQYDSTSHLSQIFFDGAAIRFDNDLLGNRERVEDPNRGTTRFTYNALGLLMNQTYATGQSASWLYDAINRKVQETTVEATTVFAYDTQPYGVGLAASSTVISSSPLTSLAPVVQDSIVYDFLSRPVTTVREIASQTLVHSQTYDEWGREVSSVYPSGLIIQNQYNQYNALVRVVEQASGFVIWEAKAWDAVDRVLNDTFANGAIRTARLYDPIYNWLTQSLIGPGQPSSAPQSSLALTRDVLGNILDRSADSGDRDRCAYDTLDRLLNCTSTAKGATTGYQYNAAGSILRYGAATLMAGSGVVLMRWPLSIPVRQRESTCTMRLATS